MSFDQKFADALRIVMYGSEGNFLEEVKDLGEVLAEFDGVPFTSQNRLTQSLLMKNSLLTKDEVKGQIISFIYNQVERRRDMLQQMVGTLYSGIIINEIESLHKLISNIKNGL